MAVTLLWQWFRSHIELHQIYICSAKSCFMSSDVIDTSKFIVRMFFWLASAGEMHRDVAVRLSQAFHLSRFGRSSSCTRNKVRIRAKTYPWYDAYDNTLSAMPREGSLYQVSLCREPPQMSTESTDRYSIAPCHVLTSGLTQSEACKANCVWKKLERTKSNCLSISYGYTRARFRYRGQSIEYDKSYMMWDRLPRVSVLLRPCTGDSLCSLYGMHRYP